MTLENAKGVRLVSLAVVPETVISAGLLPLVKYSKYSRTPPVIVNRPSNCFSQARDMVVLVVAVTLKLVAGSGVAEREV